MEIESRLAQLAGELNALEAELVGVVADAISADAWVGDGFRSVAHWLTIHLGCSPARGRQLETSARRVDEFPLLADRFRAGEVSQCQFHVVADHVPGWADREVAKLAPYGTVSQLRRIVRAQFPPDVEPDRDWVPDDNESTADAAAAGSADDTTIDADNDGAGGDDGAVGNRDGRGGAGGDGLLEDRLTYRWSPEGRLVGWFDLAAPTGIVFEAAVCEAQDRLFNARGSAVSAGEAFAYVLRQAATATAKGRIERFKHFIHIDTDNITTHNTDNGGTQTGTGGSAASREGNRGGRVRCRVSLTNGVNLPPAVADYMSCDTSTQPVWVSKSTPVGVGRSQRTVPMRLRRLIVYRDQGCRVPGCAITHVEIHHIRHWSDGGPTETDNLVSLCARHHKEHHGGGLTIHGNPDDDTLWFGDRYGQPLRTGPTPTPPGERKTRTKRGAFVHPTGEKFQIHAMGPWQRPKVP